MHTNSAHVPAEMVQGIQSCMHVLSLCVGHQAADGCQPEQSNVLHLDTPGMLFEKHFGMHFEMLFEMLWGQGRH
jgi:hypothetical protein